MNFKAQGTIEYLLIIAVVIVVALILVSLLTGFLSSGSQVSASQSKAFWSTQEIGIITAVSTTDGNASFLLKNSTSENITVTGFEVDGVVKDVTDTTLVFGEQKAFTLNGDNQVGSCSGETTSFDVVIIYSTVNGISKKVKGETKLIVECSDTASINDSVTTIVDFDGDGVLDSVDTCIGIYNPNNEDSDGDGVGDHCDGSFSGTGTGSTGDPYVITNCAMLQDMSLSLSSTYTLGSNIDCSNTIEWNDGAGFTPVGTSSPSFTGDFLGADYNISNLYIYRPTTNHIGLFGYTSSSDVNNVGIIDQNVTGQNYVGGLIGLTAGSSNSINNCFSTGTTTGTSHIGGLIGYNLTDVNNCYTTGNTNGTDYVGGLVGSLVSKTVSNSYATGNTSGTTYIGGLVGNVTNSTIDLSYATGNTTSSSSRVGGLVGETTATGTINRSYATGTTINTATGYIGGLVGENSGNLINSYSTGNVFGREAVGGLVGYNRGSIRNCYATGSANGTMWGVGGLAGTGNANSYVYNSYSTGDTNGASSSTGGIMGRNQNYIINSFSTSNIIDQGKGAFGTTPTTRINIHWYSDSSNCYVTGDVNCTKASAASDFYASTYDVYDTNLPHWDANWFWSGSTYPTLSWE